VFRALEKNRTLEAVALTDNELTDTHMLALAASLGSNASLRSVDLSRNNIAQGPGHSVRGPGVTALWHALKHNQAVREIQLCGQWAWAEDGQRVEVRPDQAAIDLETRPWTQGRLVVSRGTHGQKAARKLKSAHVAKGAVSTKPQPRYGGKKQKSMQRGRP